jgi:hypothetical protein
MSEPKSCPFCGSDSRIRISRFDGDYAGCQASHCIGRSLCIRVDAWNQRPIEDKLQAEIDRLTAEVAELKTGSKKLEEFIKSISGCVSENHGDNGLYMFPVDEDLDSQEVVTIKEIFEILENYDDYLSKVVK